MRYVLGIDPGISGGLAILSFDKKCYKTAAFKDLTPIDIVSTLKHQEIKHVYLEAVNAMPKQGVVSMFKFGMNYGWWQGVLNAIGIPIDRVYPLKWQTALGCRTGGNKNISKARAQELFPTLKVTHAIADALLIAEYGRRQLTQSTSDL